MHFVLFSFRVIHMINDYLYICMFEHKMTCHIFGINDYLLNKLEQINQPNLFSFPFSKQQWIAFINYNKN